ncbi:hypothetical protein [Novosphingobium gossypii]|uniref:hypothetical protein n=1 Tax=Novosphingobium gossypii TaxID=1604774 RepID=UPI003D1D7D86
MAPSHPRAVKPALERMARALCTADGLPENTHFEGKPMWENFIPRARAALEAIRTPTMAMAKAGDKLLSDDRGHSLSALDLADAWELMVDAALQGN